MEDKVLVIGSGAREQCLAWKLAQSNCVKIVYVAAGNAGTEYLHAECDKIQSPPNEPNCDDFVSLGNWCVSECISLVVVGPEVPLANGISDALEKAGIACFGPKSSSAQIEANKLFAKQFMMRNSIPTANYETFTCVESACSHICEASYPALVVKANGLAAGKGVVVAKDQVEACASVRAMLQERAFGEAGSEIVVEELLEGEEISVLCFSDGKHISIMPPSQDHKRQLDGDLGPNTGGMGAYCPCPQVSKEMMEYIEKNIMKKAIVGLQEEGRPYVGVLYAGLMLTKDGPKVLEFNCRFGDPECQVILPLLNSDLYDVMRACIEERLDSMSLKWKPNACAVAVVLASGGYPSSYKKGNVITGVESATEHKGIRIFQAGTKINKDKELVTSGGRVLTVVAVSDKNLETTLELAVSAISGINFAGSFHRKDIAWRGVKYQNRKTLTYAESGVSVANGERFVSQISPMAKQTSRPGCLPSLGGFGGVFDLAAAGYKNPVLVSGSDGVGTKLMLAHSCNMHTTVGFDLVAMCVNDILTHNAEPLFFLDYYACGKLLPNVAKDVIEGIAEGCRAAGCALIGGETAEMPGMYGNGTYDLGGFAVGAYENGRDVTLPCIERVVPGDVVIGVASTGIHSNGFSLVRKIVEKCCLSLSQPAPFNETRSLGECLLIPTAIYSKQLLPILRSNSGVKAVAHITGGGIVGNLPRVLPANVGANLDAHLWTVPSVFRWISKKGNVESDEMLKTFNCGIGMCLVVAAAHAHDVLLQCNKNLSAINLRASTIGEIVERKSWDPQVVVKNMEKALSSYCSNLEKDEHVNGNVDASCLLNTERKFSDVSKTITNVAVIISGSGTNLQALIDHERSNPGCSYRICFVISNKENAFGLTRAQKNGIKTKVVNHKLYKTRKQFDKVLDEQLTTANVELVCLAGFMRLLSGWFVRKWSGKILNIHPSLLPSFKGIDAHKQVLDAGVRLTGCSVHFVVEEMDAGAIVAQESVPVHHWDSVETLQERVKKMEHKTYPEALELVASGAAVFDDAENRILWKSKV